MCESEANDNVRATKKNNNNNNNDNLQNTTQKHKKKLNLNTNNLKSRLFYPLWNDLNPLI